MSRALTRTRPISNKWGSARERCNPLERIACTSMPRYRTEGPSWQRDVVSPLEPIHFCVGLQRKRSSVSGLHEKDIRGLTEAHGRTGCATGGAPTFDR